MREFPETRRNGVAALAAVLLCLFAAPSSATESDSLWGRDKALHFSASLLISADGYGGASLITRRESYRVATGAVTAIAAGAAKEVYDRYTGGDASWRDLTWDVMGATTGALVSWLVDRYLF